VDESKPLHQVKLAPGTVVGNGRYTVGGEINRGGTAVVYEGLDSALNMKVALKVRRPRRRANPRPSPAVVCMPQPPSTSRQ
jgi:serine/threonine protein kinase